MKLVGSDQPTSNAGATLAGNYHGHFHNMVETYGRHGADNRSLWLTNAKEAAAKISEATKTRQKEKEEKYGKFLRDLHSRVTESSKERNTMKIPPAKPCRLEHDFRLKSKPNGPSAREGPRDVCSKDLFQQVPKMDKVRVYLEKQLRKNSKGQHGISKLHRECMIQALMRDKASEPLKEKACNVKEESLSIAPKESNGREPMAFAKPFIVPLLPPLSGISKEPDSGTPTSWSTIPTSISSVEMRSLEHPSSNMASPKAFQTREARDSIKKTPRVLCSTEKSKSPDKQNSLLRQHKRRSQSSPSRFCGGGPRHMRGKENCRLTTESTGPSISNDNIQGHGKAQPQKCASNSEQRLTQSANDTRNSSTDEPSVGSPSSSLTPTLSTEGVTTCSMGVVVLKGREEYEVRGQGKQFFSDVWKCTMEVERRCAHERAHSLYILKKKRLEQQKTEKRHKAELLRERSLAKQREAVQMQLKNVETLKARREGIIQQHRAAERKRFLNKGWQEENPTILDIIESSQIQGCESDLTSTERLLGLDSTKTWLKLQALHRQLYLNQLAEKKWLKH